MIAKHTLCVHIINILLHAAIWPEYTSLPSFTTVISDLTSCNLNYGFSILFLFIFIVIIPLIVIIINLLHLKNTYIVRQKNIYQLYYILIILFACALSAIQLKVVLSLILRLASSESLYALSAFSKYFNNAPFANLLTYDIIFNHLLQAFVFIGFYTFIEYLIAYKTTCYSFTHLPTFLWVSRYHLSMIAILMSIYALIIFTFNELARIKWGVDMMSQGGYYILSIYECLGVNGGLLYTYYYISLETL